MYFPAATRPHLHVGLVKELEHVRVGACEAAVIVVDHKPLAAQIKYVSVSDAWKS